MEQHECKFDYRNIMRIAITAVIVTGTALSVVTCRDMSSSDRLRTQRALEKDLRKLENARDIGSGKYINIAGQLIDIHKKNADPYALSNFYYERCDSLKKFGKDNTALYAEYYLENIKDRVEKNSEANCDCRGMRRAMDILKNDNAGLYSKYQKIFGNKKLNCE